MVETGSHDVAPMTHSAYPRIRQAFGSSLWPWTPTQMLQNMFWEGLCMRLPTNDRLVPRWFLPNRRCDLGQHTVCCQVSESFLSYSKAQGNDLSTPMPQFDFPGLKPGDHWCVCAARWLQAYADGMAPPVILERCEQSALEVIPLELLQELALPGDDASVPSQESP